MSVFSLSNWIWSKTEKNDSYVDFRFEFSADKGESVLMRVSVDSDYALFINGKFAFSNQYGDYEHYKIYDELDVSNFLTDGKNVVLLTAYHNGHGSSRNKASRAGVIYEVVKDGELVAFSSNNTLCRPNPCYESGNCVFVTNQLGYTFTYNANQPFLTEFESAVVVKKECSFYPRPIKKSVFGAPVVPKSVKSTSKCHYLIDLGKETVGVPTIKFSSLTKQDITIAWGEHILDGGVRRLIKDRHFFFTYKSSEGVNEFTEYMLRLGCRYLEIFACDPIDLEYATIIPHYYPTNRKQVSIDNPLYRRIYDLCVDTLDLCMMEHYVDCPWREQSLYVFDSRNQMLCGYYAFADKNVEYAKSNLTLIANDRRDDGMLSICYPCSTNLCIPSFSLYFMLSMKEYIEHTHDTSIAIKYFHKMTDIVDTVLSKRKNGLVEKFEGEQYWNFYDWTKFSDGTLYSSERAESDAIINCLTVIALDCLQTICGYINKPFAYEGIADELRTNIRSAFMHQSGAFVMRKNTNEFTVLANVLAIMAKVTTDSETKTICDIITSDKMVDCSLSMKSLEYKVLLDCDKDRFAPFVLDEIVKNYSFMLDNDATSAWETIKGADDFHKAGSLCHGWSAVPIYVFNLLGLVK